MVLAFCRRVRAAVRVASREGMLGWWLKRLGCGRSMDLMPKPRSCWMRCGEVSGPGRMRWRDLGRIEGDRMGRVKSMHPLGAIVEGCQDEVLDSVTFE